MGAEKVLVVISFCGSGVLGPLQFLKRKVVYFMAGFLCPYCSNMMSVSEDTHSRRYPSFSSAAGKDIYWNGEQYMNEASSLIRLIELLMKEWYINREERRQLFSGIISSNDQKQSQRTKTE